MMENRKLILKGLYKTHRITIRGFITILSANVLDGDTVEIEILHNPEQPPRDFLVNKVAKIDELVPEVFKVYPLGLYLLVFSFPRDNPTEILTT